MSMRYYANQIKGLSLGYLYAYLPIPYRSQPAKRTRLTRSSICSILLTLGLTDSCRHISRARTIQESILGTILYEIYTIPMFDIVKMTSFADNTSVRRWNNYVTNLQHYQTGSFNGAMR